MELKQIHFKYDFYIKIFNLFNMEIKVKFRICLKIIYDAVGGGGGGRTVDVVLVHSECSMPYYNDILMENQLILLSEDNA